LARVQHFEAEESEALAPATPETPDAEAASGSGALDPSLEPPAAYSAAEPPSTE
jgi:hypothetical protein